MEAFTERRRLIALACARLKDLLKLCRISSQVMSEVIMHPHLLLNTPAQQHTQDYSRWFTQQQHLLTARGQYHDCCIVTSNHILLSMSQGDLLLNIIFFYNCQFFSQAKYWNSSVNEVEGTIMDKKGKVIHKLFGKWHEAVFCGDPPSATCIWRASMPSFFHENALTAFLQCTSSYYSI